MTGEHTFTARSGDLSDTMTVEKVKDKDMSYYKNPEQVVNWFDKDEMTQPAGFFSIYNTMLEITSYPEAAAVLAPFQKRALESYGDVAKGIKLLETMTDEQRDIFSRYSDCV